MKFVHIADMHFDRPFVNLSDRESMGDIRRLEQRKVFKQVIQYIKDNDVELLFISGDLYENEYIKRDTIEYINKLFKEIPNTRIFIAPGNHDPFIKNSYYNQYEWNENVKIFNSKIEKIELNEINIYGFGFDDFYCKDMGIENFTIDDKNKINILVTHGSLDSGNVEDREYNPLSRNVLKQKGFDYIALGHIHKSNFTPDENISYPGSTISLGFDELDEHGMIVGDICKDALKLNFVPLDNRKFILHELDASDINSKEELIEQIEETEFDKNEFVEIIIVGKRKFEIDKYEILKLITNENVIKIKDNTKIDYNLELLANESTLKGLFSKEMLSRLNDESLSTEERQIVEKAIKIGLEALK